MNIYHSLPLLAAALMHVTPAVAKSPTAAPRPQVLPDRYLVVLRDDVPDVASQARQLAAAAGGEVLHTYRHTIKGFAARLPAQAVTALSRNPNVRWVEADQTVSINQTYPNYQEQATWGLDRIDQASRPLDSRYGYTLNGTGVHVFVVDTGVRSTHQDLAGRVGSGYSAFGDNSSEDCNGHGTHVAGTAAGSTWGVAKAAQVVPVRVLGCDGSGTWSGVIAGVDWAAGQAANAGRKPAVMNLSLGGGASSTVDAAVQRAVGAGVTVVVAAGNSSADACKSSPAREPLAVTVGATISSDARASYSNYGKCLDLFAPGSSITSAWYTSNSAVATISGTSMASPHVAGAAALFLQANPAASPGAVARALVDGATPNVLASVGSGSPNRLLYTGTLGAPVAPDQPVYVAQITTSTTKTRTSWRAYANVEIRFLGSNGPVTGAVVTGNFNPGGTTSCITQSNGSCQLGSSSISSKTSRTTFTVQSVSGSGLIYSGLSNAVTSVVIGKP